MKRYDIPNFNQLLDDAKFKSFYQKKKNSNTPRLSPSLSNGPLVMPRALYHLFSSPLFWARLDVQTKRCARPSRGPFILFK